MDTETNARYESEVERLRRDIGSAQDALDLEFAAHAETLAKLRRMTAERDELLAICVELGVRKAFADGGPEGVVAFAASLGVKVDSPDFSATQQIAYRDS